MRIIKKYLFIVVLLLVAPSVILAAEEGQAQSVNVVLSEIRQAQNASDLSNIDCSKVSDEQWEQLGEVIMGVMHPDTGQHELMDQMMGGEGSDSLRLAHISMGQRYLGCANDKFNMMAGMMGGSMMGQYSSGDSYSDSDYKSIMNKKQYGMMGVSGWGLSNGFIWVGMIIFWLLLIAGITWLIKFLFSQPTVYKNKSEALDILKTRYAKGEITKAEFEQIKKSIS